jgi:hypothetical protein
MCRRFETELPGASVSGWFAAIAVAFSLATCCPASTVHYVDINSVNPLPPYTGWATAAQDIQSAVDAAAPGDIVLVTNGTYSAGGRAVYGTMTNRVAVDRAITVQSVNGAGVTVIQGYQLPTTSLGDGAIRCVYLTNGAALFGFTLAKGATHFSDTSSPEGSSIEAERSGGGLWCEGGTSMASNCVSRPSRRARTLLAG